MIMCAPLQKKPYHGVILHDLGIPHNILNSIPNAYVHEFQCFKPMDSLLIKVVILDSWCHHYFGHVVKPLEISDSIFCETT